MTLTHRLLGSCSLSFGVNSEPLDELKTCKISDHFRHILNLDSIAKLILHPVCQPSDIKAMITPIQTLPKDLYPPRLGIACAFGSSLSSFLEPRLKMKSSDRLLALHRRCPTPSPFPKEVPSSRGAISRKVILLCLRR